MMRSGACLVRWLLVSACALSAGCTGTSAIAPSRGELEAALAGESLQPSTAAGGELLTLNAGMRDFLATHVPDALPPGQKLRQLLRALTDSTPIVLEYRPRDTYSAADTFARGGGNCLSLSALVVALAREAGLDAAFNEVDLPPTPEMIGENRFVFFKHINAVIDLGGGDRRIVDLTEESYETRYPQRRISDRQAEAQHYNNLAMEWLERNQPGVAFRHVKRAIELSPDQAYLWGNLGTVHRRTGDYAKAEIAYRHAHHLDPADPVVISNLARLYREMDRPAQAQRYGQAAARLRSRNPFYRYAEARDAVARGDAGTALRHINAAIRARGSEPGFHHLAALIHQRLGDTAQARRHLAHAAELSEETGRAGFSRELEKLTAAW